MTGWPHYGSVTRVVVHTHVCLADGSGRLFRGRLFVDVDVPADTGKLIPVIGSFPLHCEDLRSDYLAVGGGVYRLRRADKASRSAGIALPEPRPQAAEVVGRFEYVPFDDEDFLLPPHGISDDPGLAVAVYGDGPPLIRGAASRTFDLSGLARIIEEIRAEARMNLIRRPEGLYHRAPTPMIRIRQNFEGPSPFGFEIVESVTTTTEMTFSIDRADEASAFARLLAGDRPQHALEGVVMRNSHLLPERDDVVELVREIGPTLAKLRIFDPLEIRKETLLALHDAANAPSIVSLLGRPGADRILNGLAHLMNHLQDVDALAMFGAHMRTRFAHIAARIGFELASQPVPTTIVARP